MKTLIVPLFLLALIMMNSCFARSVNRRLAITTDQIGNSNDVVSNNIATADHDHQDRTAESSDQLDLEPDVNNHHSIPRQSFGGWNMMVINVGSPQPQ